MNLRHWLRPPRHVLAIFVAVAVVSAMTLGWLIWLLLEQDKIVESQRQHERLEQAADRASAYLQGALADLERTANLPDAVTGLTHRTGRNTRAAAEPIAFPSGAAARRSHARRDFCRG